MLKAIFSPLPMFVCAFWAIVLLLDRPRKYHKRILALFMAVAALLYFGHFAYFNDFKAVLWFSETLYLFCNLSVYPLYYLYICSLTETERLSWKHFSVLLPALILCISAGICGGGYISDAPKTIIIACKIVFAVEVVLTAVFGLKKIYAYDRRLMAVYADTEGKTLIYIRHMLIVFVMTSLFSFLVNIIGKEFFTGDSWPFALVSTTFSALLFFIGLVGYRQDISSADLKDEMQIHEEGGRDYSCLREKIVKYVEDNKLYLRKDLKVSDVAAGIGSNRNYVYNAINVYTGISFNEFINRYRIDYAKVLLSGGEGKSIQEIASESGFSSEASFYRNFNLFTGTSPEKWRRKIKPQEP